LLLDKEEEDPSLSLSLPSLGVCLGEWQRERQDERGEEGSPGEEKGKWVWVFYSGVVLMAE